MKKLILLFVFIGIIINVNAQEDYQNKLIIPIEEYNRSLSSSFGIIVYQVIGKDSIVLKDKFEYFFTVEIFSNGTKVLDFTQDDYEIDVFNKRTCYINHDLFIFKVNRRPNICNGFLVFKRDDQIIKRLGFIESNSAYIFGNIYGDNRFVIGGFTSHIQGEYRHAPTLLHRNAYKENLSDLFRIYSLSDEIIRDFELEDKFNCLIIEMLEFPVSGIYEGFGYAVTEPLDLENLSINSLRRYASLSIHQLNPNMLESYSIQELRIMRNEIFANKGYIFKSNDLREYFSRQKWYNPRFVDVSEMLTEIENHNINMILNEEIRRKRE